MSTRTTPTTSTAASPAASKRGSVNHGASNGGGGGMLLTSASASSLVSSNSGSGGGAATNAATNSVSGAGAGGAEDEADEGSIGFVKTLSSDLSESDALTLLQRVVASDDLFSVFSSSDLALLSQVLSVLHFASGDKIISRGERATFAGLVLSGEFAAVLSPSLHVPLGAGTWLGEQSYFELPEGRRNADVLASSDAVLAVITFAELDALAPAHPRLHSKFVRVLGAASLRKAKHTAAVGGGVSVPSALALALPSPASSGSSTPQTPNKRSSLVASSPTAAGSGSARPQRDFLEEVKIESLYRARLAKQRQNAQAKIESEKQSRLLAERKQTRQQAIVSTLREQLARAQTQCEVLRNELAAARNSAEVEARVAAKSVQSLQEEVARWRVRYNSQVVQRQGTEDELSSVLSNMHARHLQAVSALRAAAGANNSSSGNAALDEREARLMAGVAPLGFKSVLLSDDDDATTSKPHSSASLASAKLGNTLTVPPSNVRQSSASAVKRQFRQLAKLAVTQQARDAATAAARDATKQSSNLRATVSALHERIGMLERELSTMHALEESSALASASFELQRSRLHARLDAANGVIKEQKDELNSMRLLLRTVVVTRSVRDHRTKRTLVSLLSQLGELSLEGLAHVHEARTLDEWLRSVEECENSASFGTVPMRPSETRTGMSSAVGTAAASPARTASASPALNESQVTAANLGLLGYLRSSGEQLALLRDRHRSRMAALHKTKGRMSHPALLGLVDAEAARLYSILGSLVRRLQSQQELVAHLDARVSALTAEKMEREDRVRQLEATATRVQAALDAQRAQAERDAQRQGEEALLARNEGERVRRALRSLRAEVSALAARKRELEAAIRAREEFMQRGEKQARLVAGLAAVQPSFPLYAAEEAKHSGSGAPEAGLTRPLRRADEPPLLYFADAPLSPISAIATSVPTSPSLRSRSTRPPLGEAGARSTSSGGQVDNLALPSLTPGINNAHTNVRSAPCSPHHPRPPASAAVSSSALSPRFSLSPSSTSSTGARLLSPRAVRSQAQAMMQQSQSARTHSAPRGTRKHLVHVNQL